MGRAGQPRASHRPGAPCHLWQSGSIHPLSVDRNGSRWIVLSLSLSLPCPAQDALQRIGVQGTGIGLYQACDLDRGFGQGT